MYITWSLCVWPITLVASGGTAAFVMNYTFTKDIHKNSPRLWHTYIKKCISFITENARKHKNGCYQQQILRHLTSFSNFQNYTVQDCIISSDRDESRYMELIHLAHLSSTPNIDFDPNRGGFSSKEIKMFPDRFPIQKASGRILSSNSFYFTCKMLPVFMCSIFRFFDLHWHFTLNKHLTLNLTFILLEIPHEKSAQCSWGNLTVYNFQVYFPIFSYCGHLSAFMLFPGFNKVEINLIIYLFSTFKTDTFFTVLDSGIFSSFQNLC